MTRLPYSALMRQFKEPPVEFTLREFLATSDNARWGAVMPHLLRTLHMLCPRSAHSGYEQACCHVTGASAAFFDMGRGSPYAAAPFNLVGFLGSLITKPAQRASANVCVVGDIFFPQS